MRWRRETPEEKQERLFGWREWFAWYPVPVDGAMVWLERVEVRTPNAEYGEVEYRLINRIRVKSK